MRRLALVTLAVLASCGGGRPAFAQSAVFTANRETKGTLAALNDAVAVALEGRAAVAMQVTTSNLQATATFEVSIDGGATYTPWPLSRMAAGAPTQVTGSVITLASSTERAFGMLPPAASHARLRLTSYTSGTGAAVIRASATTGALVVPFSGATTTAYTLPVETELGLATPSDSVANPGSIGQAIAHCMLWNGSTWSRCPGSSSFGFLADVARVTPGAGLSNLGKDEDGIAANGATGVLSIVVREDAPSTTTAADGRYSWLKGDSLGRLWTRNVFLTPNGDAISDETNDALRINCVTGCGGGSGGTASNFGAAFPAQGTAGGFSDGTNMQGARVFDGDSGAGSQFVLGAVLRKIASGGTVELGTPSDPIRTDPTGTTTQPISATQLPAALVGGRLDTNLGAWLGSTAPTVGQKTAANSLPVTVASDQDASLVDNAAFTDGTSRVVPQGQVFDEVAGTALTENDVAASRIDSKRATVGVIEDETTRGRRLTITAANAAKVDGSGVTQPVSAASLPLPTGASTLAEQQTQTTSLQLIDDAVSTAGAAVPAKGLQLTGTDGTNARALKTDAAGEAQVDVLSLPANAPAPNLVASANNDGACVSVTTSSTTVLASFATRKWASIVNRGSVTVYLKFAATATSGDFPLLPGEPFNWPPGISYTGVVDGIAASGSQSVCVLEW